MSSKIMEKAKLRERSKSEQKKKLKKAAKSLDKEIISLTEECKKIYIHDVVYYKREMSPHSSYFLNIDGRKMVLNLCSGIECDGYSDGGQLTKSWQVYYSLFLDPNPTGCSRLNIEEPKIFYGEDDLYEFIAELI